MESDRRKVWKSASLTKKDLEGRNPWGKANHGPAPAGT